MKVSAMFLCLCLCALTSADAATVSVTDRTVALPAPVQGQPIPRFENGWFLLRDADRRGVRLTDSTGTKSTELRPSPTAGATDMQVVDAAVNASGVVVLSATLTSADHKTASALVWLKPGGGIDKIVSVSPFAARRVAFDGQGVLWAAGRVHDQAFEEVAEFDVIRRYGPDGRLLGSLLPQSSFSKPGTALQSLLVHGGGITGFLSITAGRYVEFSASGIQTGSWSVGALPGTMVTGAAIIGRDLYLSASHADRKPVVYRLNRTDASFVEVDCGAALVGAESVLILGGEADGSLIVRVQPGGLVRSLRIEP